MSFAHCLLIASCCGGMPAGIVLASQQPSACSRVLYTSKDGNYVLVGRNMDWTEHLRSNLWVFPRGIKRDHARHEHLADPEVAERVERDRGADACPLAGGGKAVVKQDARVGLPLAVGKM